MATGAGKTYTAVTECYRLLKYGGFRRVLFLVDRNNLGDQTLREFQNYADARTTGAASPSSTTSTNSPAPAWSAPRSVVISTIQRVYAALRGEQVADVDDPSIDDYMPDSAGRGHLQRRRCRPRRSTWSSSTRRTGRSTACGVACSSTSTPTSSG
ncbi:MAG: DEAD/DEAH box helicase family protein [Geodermatophilaceae bacterium]